jgi:hypothetical protein
MADASTLGHSLKLDDGDLIMVTKVIVEDGQPRTVRTPDEISGVPNLTQALNLRILTPLGDDQFNTAYGFDAADVFARAATTRAARDLIQLNLVRTLGSDPRVREIRDVTFLDPQPGRQPRNRRRGWPVVVTIITVDGGQEAVTLTAGA